MRVIVDGVAFNVSDAESSQLDTFSLDSNGQSEVSLDLTDILGTETLYDVFIGGQKKYAGLGDFTFDSGVFTSANGSADAGLICSILIK